MKKKTSLSVDEKILAKVKAIAKREDRSLSYILEKFIEARVQELPENDDYRDGGRSPPKKRKSAA